MLDFPLPETTRCILFIAHQPRDNKHIIFSSMHICYTWVEFFSSSSFHFTLSFECEKLALCYAHPIDSIKHTGQSSCVSHMDWMKRRKRNGNGYRRHKKKMNKQSRNKNSVDLLMWIFFLLLRFGWRNQNTTFKSKLLAKFTIFCCRTTLGFVSFLFHSPLLNFVHFFFFSYHFWCFDVPAWKFLYTNEMCAFIQLLANSSTAMKNMLQRAGHLM